MKNKSSMILLAGEAVWLQIVIHGIEKQRSFLIGGVAHRDKVVILYHHFCIGLKALK